jgi:hypothetical protein
MTAFAKTRREVKARRPRTWREPWLICAYWMLSFDEQSCWQTQVKQAGHAAWLRRPSTNLLTLVDRCARC